ncbi:hypothetical protein ASC66_09500 [Leifsonia sp. Root4]|uniref:acyltransferase family protein n=1 Tax=Leifsonia sp. Root4 TaxID=1736525 RepID=UPI00070082E2|nr:acyltransferase family protein [Leifsonia sp. Root4]KQW06678.1 hypothetical protein ASC66_09500 [Leifsonia sp. Root4]
MLTGSRRVVNLRPEIQALRAVAVIIVVIYHLWPKNLSGGFVGVDVFFVISGFLITAHLLREVDRTGRISLSQFWARRLRRLLPAATTVLAACLVATVIWLPRSVWQQTFQEIGASALYGLNWLLAFNATDYLGAANQPSIVQHYWSLSVEEQFYIVWPLLLVATIGVTALLNRRRGSGGGEIPAVRTRAMLIVLTLVFVASLAFSISETARSQSSAYFITTTRAWEFAAGGLLAFVPALLPGRLSERAGILLRMSASWVGIVAIASAAFIFRGDMAFPGYIALVPVLGTVLVIWAGNIEHSWSPTFVARFAPIQLVGELSYGIYLWHWPLIVIYPILRGASPGLLGGVLIIGLSIALAWATKRLVEDPIRTGTFWAVQRRRTYSFAAAGMAMTVVLASIGWVGVDRSNQAAAAEVLAMIKDAGPCYGASAMANPDTCADPFSVPEGFDTAFFAADQGQLTKKRQGGRPCYGPALSAIGEAFSCELGEVANPSRTIAVVGDSHAVRIAESLEPYASEHGWKIVTYVRGACPGVSETPNQREDTLGNVKGCIEWSQNVKAALKTNKALDLVLLSNRTSQYSSSQKDAFVEVSADEVSAYLTEIEQAGVNVAIVRDVPSLPNGMKAPDCVAASKTDADPCNFDRGEVDAQGAMDRAIDLSPEEVDTIDLSNYFCGATTCHSVIGGVLAYFDNNHLTHTFALTLSPYLGDAVAALIDTMPSK